MKRFWTIYLLSTLLLSMLFLLLNYTAGIANPFGRQAGILLGVFSAIQFLIALACGILKIREHTLLTGTMAVAALVLSLLLTLYIVNAVLATNCG